ncbi:RNA 2',3'-cyclic phosphodiesterase [Reinekea blandensis]|uniref:RNA 2',3'-cyclic phosphodiesterase n=1 Tax=Reinekea blandensis MED297 TaxID=314283 RepID=A4BK99_9GAMM|nr:RNA 2',3'-cyclic phosphodiesterase [Reinekea blandensis]EAR07466.1 2'-5' RNA ligase [Reinekea sp. MED297] [Reinekea blandensis MED297]
MESSLRLFFALPLESDDAARVAQWQQSIAPQPRVRWVPTQNYHLTLAYLGETDASMIPELVDYATEQLDVGQLPIRWSLNHVSRFSQGIWYLRGYQEPPALQHFARALSFLVPLHTQTAPFVPHITFARCDKHLDTPDIDLAITFRRISLMQSVREGAGVRYRSLHDWTGR